MPRSGRHTKKSRHALSRAAQSCTAEDFHELRKAVKREVNQLSIFETPEPLIRDLKQLSSLLGEHHDLTVLTATLENTSSRFPPDRAAPAEGL